MITASHVMTVSWECVHFTSAEEADGVRQELAGSDLAVFDIHSSAALTEQDLFTSLASVMRFPDYFGANWDALHECLRDLSWLPAKGYVLFLTGAMDLWRRESRLAGMLVESWLFCAEEWGDDATPFHLVFVW